MLSNSQINKSQPAIATRVGSLEDTTQNILTKEKGYQSATPFINQVKDFLRAKNIGIKNNVLQFKRVNLEGVVYGRRLEIAQAVKVGDQNDSAMITEVYYSPSVNQNPQFPKDKLYDIHLKINLETLVRKDIMYYAFFQPLKVGNRLWIPLPNYNLYDLVVTKILGQQ